MSVSDRPGGLDPSRRGRSMVWLPRGAPLCAAIAVIAGGFLPALAAAGTAPSGTTPPGSTAPADPAAQKRARALAMAGYEIISGNPYDGAAQAQGVLKVDEAARLNPEEPYIYLAAGLLVLYQGFNSGDLFDAESYVGGTIPLARRIVTKALTLEPDLPRAHMLMWRIHMIDRDYGKALDSCKTVGRLEGPKSFRAPYCEGVVYGKIRMFDRARQSLARAEAQAKGDGDRVMVAARLQDVAYAEGNQAEVEHLYLRLIRLKPASAHAYGNYGTWLMQQERYDEAVTHLQKAVDLMPYGLALKYLEESKRLKALQQVKSPVKR